MPLMIGSGTLHRVATGACVLAVICVTSPAQPRTATVAGRLVVIEKGSRSADDVGQAVVWLEAARSVPTPPETVDVITAGKEFRPQVVVVPVGSLVRFPNSDPFNHNVFSRADAATFDLGLYGRGEVHGHEMKRAGVVTVYCNVHARMQAFVIVRDNPYYAQPAADGSFTIAGVPPGTYTLKAWHERAKEILEQPITVGLSGVANLRPQLDARGYQWEPHLNKFGKPYTERGRRY